MSFKFGPVPGLNVPENIAETRSKLRIKCTDNKSILLTCIYSLYPLKRSGTKDMTSATQKRVACISDVEKTIAVFVISRKNNYTPSSVYNGDLWFRF